MALVAALTPKLISYTYNICFAYFYCSRYFEHHEIHHIVINSKVGLFFMTSLSCHVMRLTGIIKENFSGGWCSGRRYSSKSVTHIVNLSYLSNSEVYLHKVLTVVALRQLCREHRLL